MNELAVDLRDDPLSQVGVLITSHPQQIRFWEHGLYSWLNYPFYLLLGYDHTDFNGVPMDKFVPPVTETFVTGKPFGKNGHLKGELWQMKIGGEILRDRGFKYFYKTAADTTCYKWRNLRNLCKLLDSPTPIGNQKEGGPYDLIRTGTAQIFGRTKILNNIMATWEDGKKCGAAELWLNARKREQGVKSVGFPAPWWEETLGRIHVQGEYAQNNNRSVSSTWQDGDRFNDAEEFNLLGRKK